jgi:hypothetical protein
MPSVIDAPEGVEHDRHDLYEEQPRVYGTRAGFWPTVVQSLRRYSTPRWQRRSSADRQAPPQLASPMARVAQEHPTLYLVGFFGMHHG